MGFQIEEYQKIQTEMGIEGFEECFEKGEWIDINQIIEEFYPDIPEISEKKLVTILTEALNNTGILLDKRKNSIISLESVREKIKIEFMDLTFDDSEDCNKLLDAVFYTHIKILKFFGFDFVSIEGYMFKKAGA